MRESRLPATTTAPFLLLCLCTTAARGTDVLINSPDLVTQSETSVAVAGNLVCTAWMQLATNQPPTLRYGYSLDGGATFAEAGEFPGLSGSIQSADPGLAYSARAGAFYFTALPQGLFGIGIWSSSDCQTFTRLGDVTNGAADKPMIAIDNDPLSPAYGRIYVFWAPSPFVGGQVESHLDYGASAWSPPVALEPGMEGTFAAWPAVAPGGDVFAAVLHGAFLQVNPPSLLQDQWIYKRSISNATWQRMANIGTAQLRPQNSAATQCCNREALNGNIAVLPSPQIAIHGNGGAYVIHAVYSYDSDGLGLGSDESDVFYRRSVDGAATWSAEVRLSGRADEDQWHPAIAADPTGFVVASWYDRRLDAGNSAFDRYAAISTNGGQTWSNSARLSDVTSAVMGTSCPGCYHGHYDQVAASAQTAHVVWSDDRRGNADVYYARIPPCPASQPCGLECNQVAPCTTYDTGFDACHQSGTILQCGGSSTVHITNCECDPTGGGGGGNQHVEPAQCAPQSQTWQCEL